MSRRIDYEEIGDKSFQQLNSYMRVLSLGEGKGFEALYSVLSFLWDVSIDYCVLRSKIEIHVHEFSYIRRFYDDRERGETARIIEKTKNSLWSEPTTRPVSIWWRDYIKIVVCGGPVKRLIIWRR